jgi:2-hydroxychromene-2-carboxylate isomerase
LPRENIITKKIEFWFDFSSPYSYIAGEQIDALAAKHEAVIDWQPMLLGAIFKASGSAPLTMRYAPLAEYAKHDFLRSARFCNVPYNPPDPFPVMSQNTARAALWIRANQPEKMGVFCRAGMVGLFVKNEGINDHAWIENTANACGADGAAAAAACNDAAIKEALKVQCDTALARGIFGGPWMIVDGEAFWGNDRLPQLDAWLTKGGF